MIASVRYVFIFALVVAGRASAQGTLSTQGLGYAPGQLSTAAITMGGSIGDADPYSPLNPASIGLLRNPIVFMQAQPEYRKMQLGDRSLKTSLARFPLFMGGMPLGSRWAIALSASTLLDRTWTTATRDTQQFGTEMIGRTVTQRSDGSIADTRLAMSFAPTTWLRLGIGGHAYSGRVVLEDLVVFDDTLRFVPASEQAAISFGGNAVSVGAQTLWPRVGAIGVSYRVGGGLRAYDGSETVGRGSVPDHLGVSLVYLGIRGTTLGVRAARDSWSKMRGMSRTLHVHEGWDIGVGGDIAGPAFGADTPLGLRLGGRWRTLPFSARGSAVRERTASGGFAFPMAGGRVELSIGALHSTRTSSGTPSESAWTMSTGFAVRP